MHPYHLPLKFNRSLILTLAHVSMWNYCKKSGEVLTDGAARGSQTFQEEIWPGQRSNETYNNLKELFYCLGHLYLFF